MKELRINYRNIIREKQIFLEENFPFGFITSYLFLNNNMMHSLNRIKPASDHNRIVAP